VNRAVAEHLLHVQGDEIEHREQRGAQQQTGDVRPGQRPPAEDPEGNQRCLRAELDGDEDSDQGHRPSQQADDLGGTPPGAARIQERVCQQGETGRDADRSGGVEVTRGRLRAALRDQSGGECERDRRGRDVDPEDPLPAKPLGEDAAEQDARGSGRAGDGAPGPEGLVALSAVLEQRGDDGQGRGRDDRGAKALCGARRDQLPLGGRETGGEGRDPDHDQAGYGVPG
jgi:hypothetical protein